MDSKPKKQEDLTADFKPKSHDPQEPKSRSKHSDNRTPSETDKQMKSRSRSRGHADANAEVNAALSILQDLRVDSASNCADEDTVGDYAPTTAAGKRFGCYTSNLVRPAPEPEDLQRQNTVSTVLTASIPNDGKDFGDGRSQNVLGSLSVGPSETFHGAGSYKFESSENVDEYLKNLGVGLVFRKVQAAANPTLTIYPCKVEEWAIKTDSIFRTREVRFRVGEEFNDETYDGRPCRTVASLDSPDRIILRQRCPMGPDVKVLYEFDQQEESITLAMNAGTHKASMKFVPNPDL